MPGASSGGFNDAPSLLGGSGARQPNPLPTAGGNGAITLDQSIQLGILHCARAHRWLRSDSNTSSMLGRLTGGTPPIPAPNPTTGAGSLSTPYASSNPAMPRVANNPLPNNSQPNNNLTNQTGAGYGAPAGYNPTGAGQGYNSNLQPSPQYDPRLAAGFTPPPTNPVGSTLPPTSQSVNPNGVLTGGSGMPLSPATPTGLQSPGDTQPGVTVDKLLPLITLMLLVINIYQFFWMSHVRTRYKEMVISKRTAQLHLSNS